MSIYRHVGIAVAFSPRLKPLLSEAAYHAQRLAPKFSLIHAGTYDAENEERLRETLREIGLADDVAIHFVNGPPAAAIIDGVVENGVDLLMAGVLEKEHPIRYLLGSVAHNLVREAPCSLMMYTEPRLEPEPARRIVVVADYSENALIVLLKVVRFAENSGAERVYVIRVAPQYGEAMLLSENVKREAARSYRVQSRQEEEAMLRDFVDAVGHSAVPLETHYIEGHTGYAAAQFVKDRRADFLVMSSPDPSPHFLQRLFPSDMEWVLRDIPCNLWVARERPTPPPVPGTTLG